MIVFTTVSTSRPDFSKLSMKLRSILILSNGNSQIAEARIAGAEVVHDDRHAHVLQLLERGHGSFVVAEQQRLGDLQSSRVRRETGALKRVGDGISMVPDSNCAGDRFTATVRCSGQCSRRAASFVQHPGPSLVDQPHFLGDRNERRRRNKRSRRTPAAAPTPQSRSAFCRQSRTQADNARRSRRARPHRGWSFRA